MIRVWRLLCTGASLYSLVVAAPQPLINNPIAIDGLNTGFPGKNGSASTVPFNLAPSAQPATTPLTSTVDQTTTPSRKSFALTPHSQVPETGFGQVSTILAQPTRGGGAGDSTYMSNTIAGVSTVPGCFHTETQGAGIVATTTVVLPCMAGPPNPVSQGSTNPNQNTGNPGGSSLVPLPQTAVPGNDPNSILHEGGAGGGGHGGIPLPGPQTSVPGGDMRSILGGPDGSGPATSPLPFAPPEAPKKTVGEPAPITASPAALPPPTPVQTVNPAPISPSERASSPTIGQQPPADGGASHSQSFVVLPPPAPTIVKPSPIITIGSSIVTAGSSSQFIVGTQTLAPGGPAITHSGTVLSLPSSGSGVIIGPSTQAVQPAVPTPVLTIGGSTITANAASQFLVGSQTVLPGGPAITHSGIVVSLAPGASSAVVAGQTQDLAPALATPPLSITVRGQVITANTASQFEVGGQTLKPGAAPIIADGQTLSLAVSGSAVVINHQTENIAQPSPTALPVITIGGAKITGNSASQYIIDGQTLAFGKPPITVSGQVLSMASSGNAVVIGPSTQAFVTPPMVLSTHLPALTIGGSTITADSASNYVVVGQTIHAGGQAITVGGTVISLAPSATALVVSGSTEQLTPTPVLATTEAPLITLGSQTLHPNAAGDYVIAGQTLNPGYAITVSGTVVSLASGALDVVIGSSTEALTPQLVSLSTGLPILTIGSQRVTANAECQYVLSGQTIRPGAHAVTIGGQLVSLAANDSMLVVGTSTEMLHGLTKTGGTISRSTTRFDGEASTTAKASFSGGSAPTLGGSSPAATTRKKSSGSRLEGSIWATACAGSLMTFMIFVL
ncbi:MAG: hypothetical protein LQ338_002917 [Usnochroma carphineum]|nr:MAG: hypothetical protein LQ338_002917 [Usnochroma carphineum]